MKVNEKVIGAAIGAVAGGTAGYFVGKIVGACHVSDSQAVPDCVNCEALDTMDNESETETDTDATKAPEAE